MDVTNQWHKLICGHGSDLAPDPVLQSCTRCTVETIVRKQEDKHGASMKTTVKK